MHCFETSAARNHQSHLVPPFEIQRDHDRVYSVDMETNPAAAIS